MTTAALAISDVQRWAAEQTVRMHTEPPSDERATGLCARCEPGGGCPMLAWALAAAGDTPAADCHG